MKMLKRERQERILKSLQTEGQVSVADLSNRFGVTEMTIRRDLQELSNRGLAQRFHGGAVSTNLNHLKLEPPILLRIKEQAIAKRLIAETVAGMIGENETLFIGSGTTALTVAEALSRRRDLTIVTNALTVVNALASSRGITIIVIGGFLRRSELSLIGHLAETAIQDLWVDKVIMGIRGIHPEYGLTSSHLQELMTDRSIMGISETVIIVADHSKFGYVAPSRLGPVTDSTLIVTDFEAPEDIVQQIKDMDVEVVIVAPHEEDQ